MSEICFFFHGQINLNLFQSLTFLYPFCSTLNFCGISLSFLSLYHFPLPFSLSTRPSLQSPFSSCSSLHPFISPLSRYLSLILPFFSSLPPLPFPFSVSLSSTLISSFLYLSVTGACSTDHALMVLCQRGRKNPPNPQIQTEATHWKKEKKKRKVE